MKKNISCLLWIAIIVVGVLPWSATAQHQAFKFGISAPLSGVLAEYGAAVRNGVILAIADNPETLNPKAIEIIYEDSQWDPKTAIAAFNALKDIKKVSLIYNWGNPTSEAVAPVAEQYKVPLLAMSSDYAITKNKKYIIRTVPPAAAIGKMLAEHLRKKGYKRLGIVSAENSYVRGLYEGVKAEYTEQGESVDLIEQIALDQQDFKSLVVKIKNRPYDALGVFLISGQVSSFFKQSAVQGLHLPTFGADFFGSQTEINAAGESINGSVFPDLGVTKEFQARYLKRFGNDIQIAFAANAYDVATMVGTLFGSSDSSSLTPDQIVAQIKLMKEFKGAHGTYRYEESAACGPMMATPIAIKGIENNSIVELETN